MLRTVAAFLLIAQLYGASFRAYSLPRGDDLNLKLQNRVCDYRLDADNFLSAIIKVADKFEIPVGIVWINAPSARTKMGLFWKVATVEEILKGIVSSQPGYELHITHGIVHIFSRRIPADKNFIFQKIEDFEVKHEVVQMAERQLRNTVKSRVAPSKSSSGGIVGSLITKVGEPTIDVTLKDASVAQILDSLALASSKKIWVVTFVDGSATTATGFMRTSTLWNDQDVPDDEQPVWDMFEWRESLPFPGIAQ